VRALAGILLVLALAPAASAETVARRTAAAGPALAGDAVAWGEESRAGAVQVLRSTPGREPQLVHEIPAATAPKTRRGFMGVPSSFAASAEAFAALTYTSTITDQGSDYVGETSAQAAIGGPVLGPGALLGGSIPERVVPGCEGIGDGVTGVDVDAGRIAVARYTVACDGNAPPQLSISIHDATGRRDVPVGAGLDIITVRIAGNYVLWVQRGLRSRDEIVLYDLARGAEVRRVRMRDLHSHDGRDAALQADGTVAFAFSRRLGGLRFGSRLAWFSAADPRVRVVRTHGWIGRLALHDGRVLYEHELRARWTSEIVLRRLGGGKPRRVARLGKRRGLVGTLDLDATRAVWAEEPRDRYDQSTGRPGRVVLRDL
jgi:hypothetical protein